MGIRSEALIQQKYHSCEVYKHAYHCHIPIICVSTGFY